jgi:hypothetical protein
MKWNGEELVLPNQEAGCIMKYIDQNHIFSYLEDQKVLILKLDWHPKDFKHPIEVNTD